MDTNLFETLKLFIRLMYSFKQGYELTKDEQKKQKRLRIQAKRVLRSQNMELSLAKLETESESLEDIMTTSFN